MSFQAQVKNFLFPRKVMYRYQDIQVFVFLSIPWFTKSMMSIWPPFIFQEELIYYQYNGIQLLNNLFKGCWKWKKKKKMVTWGKLTKIANIDRELLHIFWTTWGNSMKFSGKMCFKIILKFTKKTSVSPSP